MIVGVFGLLTDKTSPPNPLWFFDHFDASSHEARRSRSEM